MILNALPLVSAGVANAGELKVLNESFHGGNANVQMWMRVTGQPGHAGMARVFLGVLVLLIIGALLYHLARNS